MSGFEFDNVNGTIKFNGVSITGGGATDLMNPTPSFTAPPSTGWSWLNQDSAVETVESDGTIRLSKAGHLAPVSYNFRMRNAPGGAFTATAFIALECGHKPYAHGGMAIDAASGTRLYTMFARQSTTNTACNFGVERFNSPTSPDASAFTKTIGIDPRQGVWFRIEDNLTNLKFFTNFRIDGAENGWELLFQEPRANFLTGGPSRPGFYVTGENLDATPALTPGRVRLCSWAGA